MDGMMELKVYIQQEINKGKVDIDSLVNLKNQLESMLLNFSHHFVNADLNVFQPLFNEFDMGISYKKFFDAISLIDYFEQLNAKNIPQYHRALEDLKNLEIQVRNYILEVENRIQNARGVIESVSTLEKYLSILDDDGINCALTLEELKELLLIIRNSTLSSSSKFELISNITISNYEKHQLLETKTETLNADNSEFENVSEDEVKEEYVLGDDELLNKIINIVNHLKNHYNHEEIDEINFNLDITGRKQLYLKGSNYSKYNWSLIYNDLCNYLIPKYRENKDKDEIIELFNFIIKIYNNFESVKPDFEQNIREEIERTIEKINYINEDKITKWCNIINSYADEGHDCNLNEILHTTIPYSNIEILLFGKIIELKNKYNEYKEYRQYELEYRFDDYLEETIELIGKSQSEIIKLLKEIQDLNKSLVNKGIIQGEPTETNEVSIDTENGDENVHFIEEGNIENLVIFMNSTDEHNFVNIVNEIISQGNNQTTLRNITNCIYNKHYNCSNYRGLTKSKHNGYLHLVDGKGMKYLEKNKMYRSRKGDIRCVYREIHVSENNRKIIQKKYPKFTGSLFLMTGIFYKASDDNTYVSDTNRFLNIYENDVNNIVDLFAYDFQTYNDMKKALSFINVSFKQYNEACSLLETKKVGGK